MTLFEKLDQDYITAFKARDMQRTNALRLLISALKNEKINTGKELDEAAAQTVLNKEAKKRRESIEQYTAAGRTEAAAQEQAELDIIESYLPKAMDEAELEAIVEEILQQTGAQQKSDMGKVMAELKQKLANPADISKAAQLVNQRLS